MSKLEPAPDPEQIRRELESTRSDFHQLLDQIPDTAWGGRGFRSAWTVKEEMWHIAWGMRFMLDLIKNARRGIGLPKPPMFIANPLNANYSRFRAGLATRQSIAKKYDNTHSAVLAVLDTVQADEWSQGVRVFGEFQTVEHLFHGIAHHFEEHAARVRPVLKKKVN